jgi:hypothetical protein
MKYALNVALVLAMLLAFNSLIVLLFWNFGLAPALDLNEISYVSAFFLSLPFTSVKALNSMKKES